ncbi:hypothetical protein [Ruegeria hyattellae]|uniref:hypothetical protein n=1 Tax=Ruegeria hyattellae TaxID=3233337 RepID=UPI00355BCDB5
MAKKSAKEAFVAEDIKKLFLKARSSGQPVNFAFGLASKPENCGLVADLRKPANTLKSQVKDAPGIGKTCFGTFTVVEADVLLVPTKPLKGIIRQLRVKLRKEGMGKFHPRLIDADGNEIDEDTLPDEDEVGDANKGSSPEIDVAALKKRLQVLKVDLQKLGKDAPADLVKDFKTAAELFSAKDAAGAAGVVTSLEQKLTDAGPSSSKDQKAAATERSAQDLAKKLNSALAEKLAAIKALPEGEKKTALMDQVRTMASMVKSGNLSGAATSLKTLKADLEGADALLVSPREIWRDAKEGIDASITQLQSVIKGFSDPVLDRIAKSGLNGVTEGNQTALSKAMLEFEAAKGADRKKAAKALASQAAAYKQFLENDPVIELCENNPFNVNLPIRKKLGGALAKIARDCLAN